MGTFINRSQKTIMSGGQGGVGTKKTIVREYPPILKSLWCQRHGLPSLRWNGLGGTFPHSGPSPAEIGGSRGNPRRRVILQGDHKPRRKSPGTQSRGFTADSLVTGWGGKSSCLSRASQWSGKRAHQRFPREGQTRLLLGGLPGIGKGWV